MASDPLTTETKTDCGIISGYANPVKCSDTSFKYCSTNGTCLDDSPEDHKSLYDYSNISDGCGPGYIPDIWTGNGYNLDNDPEEQMTR